MKVFAVCLVAFLAFASVQSASFQFRSGRAEVLIPIEEAVRADEFVAELKKEAEDLAIEEAVPVMLEEIIVPVENLRNVEPLVAVQEPIAVADKELVVPVNALRDAAIEVVAVPEAVFVQEVRAETPAAADEVTAAKSAEKVAETVADVAQTDEAVVPADAVLRQSAVANDGDATPRPSLLQVAQNTINNLIANNPITNALNAIRNPSSADTPVIEDVQNSEIATPIDSAPVVNADSSTADAAASDAASPAAGTPAPARPTFVQQVQSGVANIQHQLQAALTNVQNSAAAAVGGGGGANRPNLIQTIQSALNRPIQAIFRPNAGTANDELDAVATDDAVAAPAVSADEVIATAVVPEAPVPVVTVVKDTIEIVSDKVDA